MSLTMEDERKLVSMILQGNKNARYAAVSDSEGKIISDEHRSNEENILTLDETKAMLLRAIQNWKIRENISPKVGKGQYAIVTYEKIKRITVPLPDDHLLFVSVDSDKDDHIKDIMKSITYVQNLVKNA
ncbi:MAG: hypothetical protein O6761_08315 [Thaumarchaeota archaeon]|nr:hypothetical protein [Nitrososphaerota archaeon]